MRGLRFAYPHGARRGARRCWRRSRLQHFNEEDATVAVRATSPPSVDALLKAVKAAGYTARPGEAQK